MAYHEYSDEHGRITRRHYNGKRFGRDDAIEVESPKLDPRAELMRLNYLATILRIQGDLAGAENARAEADRWRDELDFRSKAEATYAQLRERMSEIELEAWWRISFEDDNPTWQKIAFLSGMELERPMECYCRDLPDGQSYTCDMCAMMARVRAEMEENHD